VERRVGDGINKERNLGKERWLKRNSRNRGLGLTQKSGRDSKKTVVKVTIMPKAQSKCNLGQNRKYLLSRGGGSKRCFHGITEGGTGKVIYEKELKEPSG